MMRDKGKEVEDRNSSQRPRGKKGQSTCLKCKACVFKQLDAVRWEVGSSTGTEKQEPYHEELSEPRKGLQLVPCGPQDGKEWISGYKNEHKITQESTAEVK